MCRGLWRLRRQLDTGSIPCPWAKEGSLPTQRSRLGNLFPGQDLRNYFLLGLSHPARGKEPLGSASDDQGRKVADQPQEGWRPFACKELLNKLADAEPPIQSAIFSSKQTGKAARLGSKIGVFPFNMLKLPFCLLRNLRHILLEQRATNASNLWLFSLYATWLHWLRAIMGKKL